jgi:hypothetical protein
VISRGEAGEGGGVGDDGHAPIVRCMYGIVKPIVWFLQGIKEDSPAVRKPEETVNPRMPLPAPDIQVGQSATVPFRQYRA